MTKHILTIELKGNNTYHDMCHILSKLWVNGVKIEFVCLKLTEMMENVAHFS